MRFANMMFEPIWNSNYVDHVQITMAEDIGIGGRAGYYDGIGAARDVIQNHLIQLMALTAMEEPTSFESPACARRSSRCSSPSCSPSGSTCTTARGQYAAGWAGGVKVPGYLDEPDIPPDLDDRDLRRDQARHRQPPLVGRAVLPAHRQAARPSGHRGGRLVQARAAPAVPGPATEDLSHNALVIRVQPDEGITLRFGSKVPGTHMEIRDVNMDFAYGGSFTEASPEAYERLILDVLLGEPPLFPRHEEVEQSWRILDPIVDYWADQREAGPLRQRRLGPAVRRRHAGPRRPHLETAMTSPRGHRRRARSPPRSSPPGATPGARRWAWS